MAKMMEHFKDTTRNPGRSRWYGAPSHSIADGNVELRWPGMSAPPSSPYSPVIPQYEVFTPGAQRANYPGSQGTRNVNQLKTTAGDTRPARPNMDAFRFFYSPLYPRNNGAPAGTFPNLHAPNANTQVPFPPTPRFWLLPPYTEKPQVGSYSPGTSQPANQQGGYSIGYADVESPSRAGLGGASPARIDERIKQRFGEASSPDVAAVSFGQTDFTDPPYTFPTSVYPPAIAERIGILGEALPGYVGAKQAGAMPPSMQQSQILVASGRTREELEASARASTRQLKAGDTGSVVIEFPLAGTFTKIGWVRDQFANALLAKNLEMTGIRGSGNQFIVDFKVPPASSYTGLSNMGGIILIIGAALAITFALATLGWFVQQVHMFVNGDAEKGQPGILQNLDKTLLLAGAALVAFTLLKGGSHAKGSG